MNFLLQMIGKAYGSRPVLRPTPREMMAGSAAAAAARGDFRTALDAYRELAAENRGRLTDLMIRAHLHLVNQEYLEASHFFWAGISRLNGGADVVSEVAMVVEGTSRQTSNNLERLIDEADRQLRQGRYVRATDLFQRARAGLDTLMAANGGMILADARAEVAGAVPEKAMPLVGLAKLGDLLVRMLARTHLAANLAAGLKERALREDLAPWATRGSDVEDLLRGQLAMLQGQAQENPQHAEVHYRLGLVARAAGNLELAARAFKRVLELHPHHVLSATRLAATLLQLGKGEAVMPLLAITYTVPGQALARYEGLARTAGERAAFERAVARLCQHVAGAQTNETVKANLAFALGELGMLDEERAGWREVAVAS